MKKELKNTEYSLEKIFKDAKDFLPLLGTDYIATTLSGYTANNFKPNSDPDLELVKILVTKCKTPIIAEGRFENPRQVLSAFENGAAAVVVGTAITNPREITRKFVNQIGNF